MKVSRVTITVGASVAGALWIACATTDLHLLIGGLYNPALDCVDPGTAIDVLNGASVDASCEAACILPPVDSGLYVTGQCAPFPSDDIVIRDSAVCTKALAAIRRSDLCLEGGPSNPLPDGGTKSVTVDATTETSDGHVSSDAHGDAKDAGSAEGASHEAAASDASAG